MSDVVAVGLITAGSSLVAASIGAVTTYWVSKRNSETAIATAEQHADVEMKKVEAENRRLREERREGERLARKDLYTRLMAALHDIDELGQRQPIWEEVKDASNRVVLLHSEILLVAPKPVGVAIGPVVNALSAVWGEASSTGRTDGDTSEEWGKRWHAAYTKVREEISSLEGKLVVAMTADISLIDEVEGGQEDS